MANLEHLRTLVTVYRARSFSEAATLLGVSQPTVTAHIKALEAELGYAVFDREPGGVSATAKGDELARRAAVHIDALEDMGEGSERAVHVGGAADFLTVMVLPHLPSTVRTTVTFGLADQQLELLRDGTLDLVVSSVQPRGPGFEAVPFYDEEFHLVGAPRWEGVPLDDVPVIAYSSDLPIIRRYWRSVFMTRPQLHVAAVIPDLRGILAAVEGGIGMSVLPGYLLREALAQERVIELHVPEFSPLNTLYVVTRAGETDGVVRSLASLIPGLSSLIA